MYIPRTCGPDPLAVGAKANKQALGSECLIGTNYCQALGSNCQTLAANCQLGAIRQALGTIAIVPFVMPFGPIVLGPCTLRPCTSAITGYKEASTVSRLRFRQCLSSSSNYA